VKNIFFVIDPTPAVPRPTPLRAPTHPSAPYPAQVKPTWRHCHVVVAAAQIDVVHGGLVRPHAQRARGGKKAGGGGGVCVFSPPPPTTHWRGMGLRRLDRHGARPTNEASLRLRRPSLRVPSRTAARLDQQVRPPPLPCLAPSRSPAHRSAVLPTCSGDADLEHRGHQGCGTRRWRVRRAARARRQQMPKGGRRAGGRFFFFVFCLYSVSHPLFAPLVSAEAVTAAAAAAAGPVPSRRALSLQQGALRVAVAPAEARRVRCGPF